MKFIIILFILLNVLHGTTYNLTISDNPRYVWFRVAKVATRSIYQVLENNEAAFTVNSFNIPFDPIKYKNHFKFAFVRNAWSRAVSCYFDKVVSRNNPRYKSCFGKSFAFFVDFISKQDLTKGDPHIRLQSKLFPISEMNFIGRMEKFEEDLKFVCREIGLESGEVPKKHVTKHKHYSTYYNATTRSMIGRMYKEDIDNFDYEFETTAIGLISPAL